MEDCNKEFKKLESGEENDFLKGYTTKFNPEHTKLNLYDSNKLEVGFLFVEKIEGYFDKQGEESKGGGNKYPDIFLMFQVQYRMQGDYLFY